MWRWEPLEQTAHHLREEGFRIETHCFDVSEREKIITSLLPEDQVITSTKAQSGIVTRNRKVLTAFRRELRKAGLSEPTVERHVGDVFPLEQVRQALQEVLADTTKEPLSMRAVAAEVGYPYRTINTHPPDLCQAITRRHWACRTAQGNALRC